VGSRRTGKAKKAREVSGGRTEKNLICSTNEREKNSKKVSGGAESGGERVRGMPPIIFAG